MLTKGESGSSKPSVTYRKGAYRLVFAFLALLVAALQFAGSCQFDSGAVADKCPIWDSDCDSISTAVEINPANAAYHFDTTVKDLNPSLAVGSWTNGQLTGGLNLPDVNGGYFHYFPGSDPRWDVVDSNDWGTLALINAIEATARDWIDFSEENRVCNQFTNFITRAPKFDVGDMSKRGGGYWSDSNGQQRHAGHQNGLEVDVRYVRKDKANSPLDIRANPAAYDTNATFDLMSCFVADAQVNVIYVDSASVGFWNASGVSILVNDTTHNTHFHVQLKQP